jgi:hypothetical protein
VQAIPLGRHEVLPANQAIAMTQARAEEIANHVDYGQPLALAADNYAVLFRCVVDLYAAAHQCSSGWLASGDEKHQLRPRPWPSRQGC